MSVARPLRYLEARLALAFAKAWDDKRPTRAELLCAEDKVWLRLFAMKLTGEWVLVHDEQPVPILTEEHADNLLAHGLSVFLMKHRAWPS